MKRFTIGVLAVFFATGLAIAIAGAGQPQDAERLFKAAMNTEMVDGKLADAIEQYKKVVASGNRPLAAQALVRMADCYQKLGDAQAKRIYEQLVRDYADQKDAVTIARARLGNGSPATTGAKGDRAVWTGPDVDLFGTVSPDGRFLTYVDWNGNQNLMLRDLVANTSRALTSNSKPSEFGSADFSAISRNGDQVAYYWGSPAREFRVASLKGSGIPTFKVVRKGEYLRPFNWSPDNTSVAVVVDDRQLGIVSVHDGTLRKLKWIDWRTVDNVVFSPDGRYLAYDVENAERRGSRGIMVMATDATGEVAVVSDAVSNYLMGWSPAGDIVFTSDRAGTRSLWAVRVENGRPSGQPIMVKPDVRATFSLGLTPSGSLYSHQLASSGHVSIAPFDTVGGKVLSAEAGRPFQQFIERKGLPKWSADGQHLMFFSCGVRNWPCDLFIRSVDTGQVRSVIHDMRYIGFASLSPDGHAVVANGSDVKGRQGIFLIDGTTGATSLLVERRVPDHRDPEWSPDGKKIRFSERRDKDLVLLERTTDSEEARELFRTPNAGISRMSVSPDNRLVGFVRRDSTGAQESFVFVVAPLAGGPSRELPLPPGVPDVLFWQWAPDSQSVILQKSVAATEGIELWQLPMSGTARKLDIDGRLWSSFHISPDGKQIAFEARTGKAGNEVWALENFLPTQTAKK